MEVLMKFEFINKSYTFISVNRLCEERSDVAISGNHKPHEIASLRSQ